MDLWEDIEMDLELFLNKGNIEEEIVEYGATKKFTDEKGEPVKWQIRRMGINEYEKIRKSCTKMTSKTVIFDNELFMRKLIAESVKYPNMNNVELQDSYGVKKAEDLVPLMFANVGEYYDMQKFINELNGFKSAEMEIEEAKN